MDHEMLALPDHDEAARMQYIVALKRTLLNVTGGNKRAVDGRAGDAFAERTGARPESWTEIGEALAPDPYYQLWSALSRSAQDMLWSAAGRSVRRELPRLQQAAQRLGNRPAGGSLDMPNDFAPPDDAFAAHIHGQPGGLLYVDKDAAFYSGAIYEAGGRVFASSYSRAADDTAVGPVAKRIAERYPDFAPRKVLDMGCSAGSSTMGLAASFAGIEALHGIDYGPGLVRYAHLRAEASGVKAHFHQMDAGALRFEDESFDLVFASLLLHEASPEKHRDIFREALRVVRPGGLVVFQDVPIKAADPAPFDRFISSWQTNNNDEPFWDLFIDSNFPAMMAKAGSDPAHVHEDAAPIVGGNRSWYMLIGEKPGPNGEIGRIG